MSFSFSICFEVVPEDTNEWNPETAPHATVMNNIGQIGNVGFEMTAGACIVGLTTEPERLVEIRRNRINLLKENKATNYINIEKISREVEEAKKLFKKYNCPTVDVTRKSVEETAASIIKIYEISKNND